ncbi:MAG TPA: class I SAM-dependent methyltransferase [Candidatus Limnocylindrales bacterium]|nr:class I SAM-dependent methyltransferase [Candidatus Limnocylindrales bacterium]
MAELNPCDCPGCANRFSDKAAAEGLRRYRRSGPDPTTRELLGAIVAQGVEGASVLDIGGGIGAIQLELLAAGARTTTSVDASPPYVAAAAAEAASRGLAERARHIEADFVAVAAEVEAADVVTLDRMICCYSDMPALMGRSVEHARRMIGLVYPRDAWWTRSLAAVMNASGRLLRGRLRWYIHPEPEIDRRIRAAGFERRFLRRHVLWQVALYVRSAG